MSNFISVEVLPPFQLELLFHLLVPTFAHCCLHLLPSAGVPGQHSSHFQRGSFLHFLLLLCLLLLKYNPLGRNQREVIHKLLVSPNLEPVT